MKPFHTFHIKTYGCTLNETDTDKMRYILKANGHVETDEEHADVVILNTCTVKHATESKIMEAIKKLIGREKRIVVAGCLYRRHKRLRTLSENIVVISPATIHSIAEAFEHALNGRPYCNLPNQLDQITTNNISVTPPDWATDNKNNGRFVVSIPLCQGCNGMCTYCETRLARGPLKSYPFETVVKLFEKAVGMGFKEIRLTAQDTGCYGKDFHLYANRNGLGHGDRDDLVSLLDKLVEYRGEHRIRLGMINPEHAYQMLDELIAVYENEHMYKFLHIPVQTGSDEVLKHMKRRYTIDQVTEIVRSFRKRFKDMTIATDIISGYPTETEEKHEKTLTLLRTVEFDIVNLSRFTPRPGTYAAGLKQLDNKIVKRRTVELHNVIRESMIVRNKRFVGGKHKVLLTEKSKKVKGNASVRWNGPIEHSHSNWQSIELIGRTNSYRKIALHADETLLGEWVNVKIVGHTPTTLLGRIIE